ncbi:DNA phosphorothioation system sulfurtransferase DndC [Streptomyces kaniharaensis]|uniref:DNA phosphorothioation system sulfurtransferase DndC n=1 Tax=Streptomyces kaniharaensis TaxID=212423 RepID=A0A6N7L4F2_9ACTN|nr:DNA phosphorothioation system sulfurtransferase DndC [Streptomyces kaniharaensis]
MPGLAPTRRSWRGDRNFWTALKELLEEIRALYTEDQVPWVVGYSGGKDSTLVLLLVWRAIAGLPPEQRHKRIYVISTDTLVENPVVSSWVGGHLEAMRAAAAEQSLPLEVHRLTPELKDSFWVCLIGRGYAAPRPKFRWCTERLKIKPSGKFIRDVVSHHGQAILLLGTRKAESAARARTMARHEKDRVRDRLSPNAGLPNSLVYTPIEHLTNDDVWEVLMMLDKLPWGRSAKELLALYQGASPDAECPLVVDTSTPSCGDSRFGCWTCTLVSADKSMTAMIVNDDANDWMHPLLRLRDALDVDDDRHLREFQRANGSLTVHRGRLVHGLYTQQARAEWLRQLLTAQQQVRRRAPEGLRGIELVSMAELEEIRRIWVFDKHEVEDLLPGIWQEVTGEPWPGPTAQDLMTLPADSLDILAEVCGEDRRMYEGLRTMLGIERSFRARGVRRGLLDELEKAVRRFSFATEEEALEFALKHGDKEERGDEQLSLLFEDGFGSG